MVKLLLSKGTEPTLQDGLGNTAAHYLAFSPKKKSKILKCFMSRDFGFMIRIKIRNKLDVSRPPEVTKRISFVPVHVQENSHQSQVYLSTQEICPKGPATESRPSRS